MASWARKHLTYANVGVTLCLFVLLGGGAYAAAKLGKNSVGSKQIKDGGVKTRDLGRSAVTGAKIADGAVGASDLAPDAVNLGDLNAAKVGGMEVKKVNFQVPPGTPNTSVLSYPGNLDVVARCQSSGDKIDVSATTGKAGSSISVTEMADAADDTDGVRDIDSSFDTDFQPGEVFPIDRYTELGVTDATVHYLSADGFVAVAYLQLALTNGQCRLSGYAIGG